MTIIITTINILIIETTELGTRTKFKLSISTFSKTLSTKLFTVKKAALIFRKH